MSGKESLVPAGPLRLGEMLIATFRYMRGNPAATLGVGALLGTVTSTVSGIVMNGVVFGNQQGTELQRLLAGETLNQAGIDRAITQLGDVAPYLAVAGAVSALIQLAAMGVMTLGFVRALQGERLQPSALWREVPWRRIVGINLMVFVLVLVAVSVPVGLALLAGGTAAIAALTVACILAFMIAVVSTLAVPAAVVEELGVKAALRRALAVSRGAIFRTTGLILASLLFWDAVGTLLGTPIGGIFGALAGGTTSAAGDALTTLVSGIVVGAITLPATSAMAVLVFVDRVARMRPPSE
jgi:hypothetical protein